MTKPSREDVLRVAKECGFLLAGKGGDPSGIWEPTGGENVTEYLQRFAAAMYAAGAEEMRERVCVKVKAMTATTDEWSEDFEFTEKRVATEIHDVIRALPITPTNTEGEQDADV